MIQVRGDFCVAKLPISPRTVTMSGPLAVNSDKIFTGYMKGFAMSGSLKYVYYMGEEFFINGRLPLAVGRLFRDLQRRDITLVNLSDLWKDKEGRPWEELKDMWGESLLIAVRDEVLQEVRHLPLAVLACRSPVFPKESLFGTDFLAESLSDVDFYFLERVYQRKHGIPWRVIDTKRCYLREMTLEDLPALYRMYEGKGITKYVPPLYNWEEEVEYTRAYIEKMYPYFGYGMWLVMDRDTHELIGRAGLNPNLVDDEYLLEMGYIIDAGHQGNGYGTEVCEAVISYAKEADVGFDKLYCFVQKGNRASLALLNKFHFSFEKIQMREGKEMLRFSLDIEMK